jgi:hypothetical protein
MDAGPHHHTLRGRPAALSAAAMTERLRAEGAPEGEVRAWELGAEGERIAAHILSRLGPEWLVLHDVPVGSQGANIDHVALGPKGVFTINTKHHPRAAVVVHGDQVLVRGEPCDYVRKARFEGNRASALITRQTGQFVAVQPLLLFVRAATVKVHTQPRGVLVTTDNELIDFLESFSRVHFGTRKAELVNVAVRPETWASDSGAPSSVRASGSVTTANRWLRRVCAVGAVAATVLYVVVRVGSLLGT